MVIDKEFPMIPRLLTIAGSDSGGGAGIQADLKTFTVMGTYGMSVITALTAQNTLGVQSIAAVEPHFVAEQLDAVLSDIGVDAAKTGMLNTMGVIDVVVDAIAKYRVPNLVVDPVMISKSGHKLLRDDAIEAMRKRLLPLASVVTPNTEEAAILAGMPKVGNPREALEAARRIIDLGPKSVVIKGGHLNGATSDDLWFDGTNSIVLSTLRYENRHTHGTGCTFSAALAACLARNLAPVEAVRYAKDFVCEAIRSATPLGSGIGPVNHLWKMDRAIHSPQ